MKAQYEARIKELEKSIKLYAQKLSSQYQLTLSKQLEQINTNNSESIDKIIKIGRDRESQINQLIEALELKDKWSNDTSNFVTNKSYKGSQIQILILLMSSIPQMKIHPSAASSLMKILKVSIVTRNKKINTKILWLNLVI